jgi:hypothetical protein
VIPVLAAAALLASARVPYYSDLEGPGVDEVWFPSGVVLEVISWDSAWAGEGESHFYGVDGLRMVSGGYADTLCWLAGLPREAIASARAAGAKLSVETRRMTILSCTGSFVGGRISVQSDRDGRVTSRYEAFRTWLLGGIPLDIESVVQTDSQFTAGLREELGVPAGAGLDAWLWTSGYWLDPQSFLISESEGGMSLVVALPCWTGANDPLLVTLRLDSLNTALGAMLD